MKLINWTTVLRPKENDLIYTFQIISDIEHFFFFLMYQLDIWYVYLGLMLTFH